jgi:predicted anti-sigma-YlaC factor YlaD
MSKECIQIKEMMQAALDGVLTGEERADFEQHLAMCMDCGAEFRAFQFSLGLLASLPVPEPGPGFTAETIRKAVKAKQRHQRQEWFFSWFMALVLLSASAFMVIGWVEAVQPAIGRMITGLLYGFTELWALGNGLMRVASVLLSTLWTLIRAALPLSSQGWGMLYFEFGIALAIMLSLSFIFKLRRLKARTMIFSF